MNNTQTRSVANLQQPLTWELLVGLEPQLQTVKVIAESISDGHGDCTEQLWYQEVKPHVVRLVGDSRKVSHPVLSLEQAYDVAYEHLRALLAPCRSCPWCREEQD